MLGAGAHVTIFARRQKQLDEAKVEIEAAKRCDSQVITAVAADMSNARTVRVIHLTCHR